jgi:hypothetical protein
MPYHLNGSIQYGNNFVNKKAASNEAAKTFYLYKSQPLSNFFGLG